MYHDSENFDQLRRLLALKRYEQPPPGYFQNFPGRVIARIRAGERAEESSAVWRLFWEAPWLQRVWAAIETKPILAGAVGVAACLLLLAGVVYSTENADSVPAPYVASQAMEASLNLSDHSPRSPSVEPAALADFQMTNGFGAAPSQGSLLGLPVQQVNFIAPGN